MSKIEILDAHSSETNEIPLQKKSSKKNDEKELKPRLFTVVLEVMSPTIITHRVVAKTPEEAADIVQKNPLASTIIERRPILSKLRKLKITVYKAGTHMIEFVRNL